MGNKNGYAGRFAGQYLNLTTRTITDAYNGSSTSNVREFFSFERAEINSIQNTIRPTVGVSRWQWGTLGNSGCSSKNLLHEGTVVLPSGTVRV
jgi:hypothetical protein